MNFQDDKLIGLKLYPIELGQKRSRTQRGTPKMATSKEALKVLKIIKALSEPYGTKILIKNNIGNVIINS